MLSGQKVSGDYCRVCLFSYFRHELGLAQKLVAMKPACGEEAIVLLGLALTATAWHPSAAIGTSRQKAGVL